MKTHTHPEGKVILGSSFDQEVKTEVETLGKFNLIICDPPYGLGKEIASWDVADYKKWMDVCCEFASDNSTILMWGGIGKKNNRPFLKFAAVFEDIFTDWEIKNWITWKKCRAYGTKSNYLFTREECLILTRGEPTFNIPLLEEKRGYTGFNKDYPAKSEYLRRTNVFTDIKELFSGKCHPTQKPDKLYQVLIETHSNEGDYVLDPCAGSLTTARACISTKRKFVCVEMDEGYISKGIEATKKIDGKHWYSVIDNGGVKEIDDDE